MSDSQHLPLATSATNFKRASRKRTRLKMALEGPAGSGKTYSALRIAKGLGGKTVVIDTERGAANFYADTFEFDILELTHHLPKNYVDAIQAAEAAGYEIIILDSISHEWQALLEWVDQRKGTSRNQMAPWKDATPMHNRFIEAMIQSPAHVIVTMRVKSDWAMEKDEKGRTSPHLVGLASVQREGMDFEFRLIFRIDGTHSAVATGTHAAASSSSPRAASLKSPSTEEYRMGIPKTRNLGKTLQEMGLAAVQNDFRYWSERVQQGGKPATGEVKKFLDQASEWLEKNASSSGSKPNNRGNEPPPLDDEDILF
jgi:hypothetical protein